MRAGDVLSESPQPVRLPALDVADAAVPGVSLDVRQMAGNDWAILLSEGAADMAAATEALQEASSNRFEPAAAFRLAAPALGSDTVSAILARLELDACGAWVTICSAGTPQPVVLRKAGWIDLRGQLRPALSRSSRVGLADDRVGLGPGDSIVMLSRELVALEDSDGRPFGDEALPNALLSACDRDAAGIVAEIGAAAAQFSQDPAHSAVLVARVPDLPPDELRERMATASGMSAEQMRALRYPLGEQLMRRPPAPPRHARMRVRGELARVSEVRSLLRRLLASWRMQGELIDDVELLASELTSNAIGHGQGPVTVIVRYDGSCIRIEVGDGSRELPRQRAPHEADEGGRGMILVEALSRDWGTIATVDGKRVWCEVALTPDTH
ncbi:MAG: hypothetical protein QOE64_1541 [Frankiales bacterium]|nr:hypothetical protein [Frankiales bacterium]